MIDLGTPGWSVVGVVGGWALLTRARRSRWIDLRAWPPKLLPERDERALAVCPGATLVDGAVATYAAPDKRRSRIALAGSYHAIGHVDGELAVASPPLVWRGGAWHPLAGTGGGDPARSAIVALDGGGTLVVWHGRVLRHEAGTLVETDAGDLPPGGADVVPTGDGLLAIGGGKLVIVARAGKQRDDRRVGKLELASVTRYEDGLLVGDGRRYWRSDMDARTLEPFDLGFEPPPQALFAAPCGLIALADHARRLVRVRV